MSRRGFLLGAALLLLAAPDLAAAFELHTTTAGEPLRWSDFPVAYVLGVPAAGSPDLRRERLRLLRRGFEAWGLPARSAVALSYQGTIPEALLTGDGQSSAVILEEGPWPPELGDAQTIAGATLHEVEAGTSRLLEVDIGINAVAFRWADETVTADALDLWSVVTHEVGHLLGLDHTCDGPGPVSCAVAGPGLQAAAMYPAATPGEVSRRAPADDDLSGLESVYGPGGEPAPTAAPAWSRCPASLRVADQSGAFTGEVFAVEARTGTRVALGSAEPGDGRVDLSALEALSPGTWDVGLVGASGKERTHFALLSLPETCPEDDTTGCQSVAGGAGDPPALVAGLALLGLSLLARRGGAG